MDIAEARKRLPALADLDDNLFVEAVQELYYPDTPVETLAKELGVKPPAPVTPSATFGDRAKDVGVSLMKGGVGAVQGMVGLADMATSGGAGKALEDTGIDLKGAQQYWGDKYSPAQKAAFDKVSKAEGIVDIAKEAITNPSVIAHSAIESLPAMAVGGVFGRGAMALAPRIGGAAAAAIGEGTIMAGSQAETIRGQTADGLLTGEQVGLSGLTGVAGGALGLFGAKLAHRLGLADVDALMVGVRASTQNAKSVTRQVLQGALSEGFLEELPQSVVEQVLQNKALGKPLDEGVDQAAVMGTLTGAAMGGAVNLMARRKPTIADIQDAPDVDSAIAAAQAALKTPTPVVPPIQALTPRAPGVDAQSSPVAPVAPSTTGTEPAAASPPEPINNYGLTDSETIAGLNGFMGSMRGQAEDQKQDQLATEAEQRMRREVDQEAQGMRQWPAKTLPRREPTLPELDTAIQPGDILDKAGAPFKELAAKLKLKALKGQGTLVQINGGWIVRPKQENPNATQPDGAGSTSAVPAPAAQAATPDVLAASVAAPDLRSQALRPGDGPVAGADATTARTDDSGQAPGAAPYRGDQASGGAGVQGGGQPLADAQTPPPTAPAPVSAGNSTPLAVQPRTDGVAGAMRQAEQPDAALSHDQKKILVDALGEDFEHEYQQDVKDAILEKRGMKPAAREDNPKNTPIRAWLRSVGITPKLAADITGDRALRANNILPATIRKGGLQLDQLVQRAVEQGFLSAQEVEADSVAASVRLIDMIQADIRGEKQVPAGMATDEYARQSQARVAGEPEDAARAIGFDTQGLDDGQVADALKRIERRRQQAVLRLQKFDAKREAQADRAAIDLANAVPAEVLAELEALAQADKEAQNRDYIDVLLAGLENQDEKTSQSQEGDPGSGRAAGLAQGGPAAGDSVGPNAASAEGQAEGLSAPTREDIRAQQDRAEQADKAEADAKRQSDKAQADEANRKEIARRSQAAADTFELGGDAQTNLSGQGGMFDAPSAPADPYAHLSDKDITLKLPTADGKTAKLTLNAREAMLDLDRRQEALEMVKRCLA